MRVAEQRRSDRGLPRGLFEESATISSITKKTYSLDEFRSGLSLRVAQGILAQFYRDKTMNPDRLFFGSFLLAKQKKGTRCRATLGYVE